MRTIIAGSRGIADIRLVETAVKESGFEVTSVLCGMARGVDLLGKAWARANNIQVVEYSADRNTHGKKAGFLRNTRMAENADALIAIWDGASHGTQHMISEAEKHNLESQTKA